MKERIWKWIKKHYYLYELSDLEMSLTFFEITYKDYVIERKRILTELKLL